MKKARGLAIFMILGTAVMADIPDADETQFSRSPSRPDDEAIRLISSSTLESTTPEGDTPMRPDTVSPGADQRVLNPHFMEVKVVYPYPEKQPEKQSSWWQRVYNYLFR